MPLSISTGDFPGLQFVNEEQLLAQTSHFLLVGDLFGSPMGISVTTWPTLHTERLLGPPP